MENRELYWEKFYCRNTETVNPDIWINCYMNLFNKKDRIIEFGCGEGYLSEYLLKQHFNVLSTDISNSALKTLKSRLPESTLMQVDIEKNLPFEDNSYEIIIADLCLHYFSEELTKLIINGFKRILTKGGRVLARVNSKNDINYGAGYGVEIEKGYFNQKGHFKRFFDREMINSFFSGWSELSVSEKTTSHYLKDKYIFEIIAVK